MSEFNERGEELPDPTPLEIPAHMRRPVDIHEAIQRMVRQELSRQAVDEGNESFEEANDFEIEGDEFEDHLSPYEQSEMQEDNPVGGSVAAGVPQVTGGLPASNGEQGVSAVRSTNNSGSENANTSQPVPAVPPTA